MIKPKTIYDMANSPIARQLRKSCIVHKMDKIEHSFSPAVPGEVEMLLVWAAHNCYEFGYTPEDVELVKDTFDYDSQERTGIILTQKKVQPNLKSIMYFASKRQEESDNKLNESSLKVQMLEANIEAKKAKIKLLWKEMYALLAILAFVVIILR